MNHINIIVKQSKTYIFDIITYSYGTNSCTYTDTGLLLILCLFVFFFYIYFLTRKPLSEAQSMPATDPRFVNIIFVRSVFPMNVCVEIYVHRLQLPMKSHPQSAHQTITHNLTYRGTFGVYRDSLVLYETLMYNVRAANYIFGYIANKRTNIVLRNWFNYAYDHIKV